MAGAGRHLVDAELAELAAFADGSLPRRRLELVAARLEGSPQLRAVVAEQRAALRAVRAIEVAAPARLYAGLEIESNRRPAERRRAGRPLAVAGALAATAAVVAVVLRPAGEVEPTLDAVAGLADRSATAPAPPGAPGRLAVSVAGVSFPDFRSALGWRATGAREDDLEGRMTRTVYYARRDRAVAYSIVSGDALAWPAEAQTARRRKTEFRFLRRGARTIVTWPRGGQTCVLSGAGTPPRELLELAAWTPRRTVGS